MFGRELNVAVDIMLGNPSGPPKSVNDYAEHLMDMMAGAYEEVREHLGRSGNRAKQYCDFGSSNQETLSGAIRLASSLGGALNGSAATAGHGRS